MHKLKSHITNTSNNFISIHVTKIVGTCGICRVDVELKIIFAQKMKIQKKSILKWKITQFQ